MASQMSKVFQMMELLFLKQKNIDKKLEKERKQNDDLKKRVKELELQLEASKARSRRKRNKDKKVISVKKSRWKQTRINSTPSNGKGYLIGNEKKHRKCKRKRDDIDDAFADCQHDPAIKKRKITTKNK